MREDAEHWFRQCLGRSMWSPEFNVGIHACLVVVATDHLILHRGVLRHPCVHHFSVVPRWVSPFAGGASSPGAFTVSMPRAYVFRLACALLCLYTASVFLRRAYVFRLCVRCAVVCSGVLHRGEVSHLWLHPVQPSAGGVSRCPATSFSYGVRVRFPLAYAYESSCIEVEGHTQFNLRPGGISRCPATFSVQRMRPFFSLHALAVRVRLRRFAVHLRAYGCVAGVRGEGFGQFPQPCGEGRSFGRISEKCHLSVDVLVSFFSKAGSCCGCFQLL